MVIISVKSGRYVSQCRCLERADKNCNFALIKSEDGMKNIYVVIVAAGVGTRFGGDLPKQFCMLAGRPVLFHTVDSFRRALPQARIIAVVSDSMVGYWDDLCMRHGYESPDVVIGGASRWESVKNALDSIADDTDDAAVLVHDGARPLVSAGVISRVAAGIGTAASVIPVTGVTDSLRFLSADGSSTAVPRSEYRAVQTPQGFLLKHLKQAYALPYSTAFTDDASVMGAAGMTGAMLVDGSPENIKITNPGDIALASFYLTGK